MTEEEITEEQVIEWFQEQFDKMLGNPIWDVIVVGILFLLCILYWIFV